MTPRSSKNEGSMEGHIAYFIPSDGDSATQPNVFPITVPASQLTLRDVVEVRL